MCLAARGLAWCSPTSRTEPLTCKPSVPFPKFTQELVLEAQLRMPGEGEGRRASHAWRAVAAQLSWVTADGCRALPHDGCAGRSGMPVPQAAIYVLR